MISAVGLAVFRIVAETQKIDTLLFGEIKDDCKGTVLFKVVAIAANIILGGVILGATVGIVLSGVQILTARDNPDQVSKAKQRIINVIIGIIAAALMYVILNFVVPGGVTLDSAIFKYDENGCPDVPQLSGDNPTTGGGQDPENPTTGGGTYPDGYTALTDGTGTVNGTGNWSGYKFVNTKQKVQSLASTLKSHHFNQDKKLYSWNSFIREMKDKTDPEWQLGKCDKISRTIGHDLLTNSKTSDGCSIHRGSYNQWHTVKDPDQSKILAAAYNQLANGRPVIMVVCWKKPDGCSRHFTTVVGYKSSVTSGANLKPEDLVTLDTCGSLIKVGSNSATSGIKMRKDNNSDSYRIDIPTNTLMGMGSEDMTSCTLKSPNGPTALPQ